MQQTTTLQKKDNDKKSAEPVSPVQKEHVPNIEEMVPEVGVPLFLQRFSTSYPLPPVQRILDEEEEQKEASIFPKLTVEQADNEYEREADEVSDRVISMPDSVIQRKRTGSQSAEANGDLSKAHLHMASRIQFMQSGGRPLPESARSYFEPRFGYDFNHVRVHTGSYAAETSRLINARAFTVGPHIVFGEDQFSPETHEGRKLLAHELEHVAQQNRGEINSTLHRKPNVDVKASDDTATVAAPVKRVSRRKKKGAKVKDAPFAKDLIKATYPHLAKVLLPGHLRAVQEVIDWRIQNRKINREIVDFDRRERAKAVREGMSGDSYRYLSSYNVKLERLQAKLEEAPTVFRIEVDTSKLIDPLILKEQDWNVQAEKEFRESWFRALISKPTVLEICSDVNRDEVFRGIFWNGRDLSTEGGLITWNKLLEIPGAFPDYIHRVLHSPIATAAKENFKQLHSCYVIAKSDFEFECERKSEYPIVSAISELFSSEIDLNAASKLLPEGKSFKDMSLFEIAEFLDNVDKKQLEKFKRVLPSSDEVLSIYKHLLHIDTAVSLGKYEAALVTMPIVADEIEEMYRKVISYRQRTTEGAARVVTGLQLVRKGCNIVLTVGGGVMGKAYGLIGISAGSAAGAGIGTLSQETAMQLSEGHADPGSILYKTGKDVAITFIFSMIGGALGGKFASLLGSRLAKIIPNEGVRIFVIGRVADASSGILTTPIEAVAARMLEGKWPKSKDLLMDMVVNAAMAVIIGGAVDIITGVPNLKGREWDSLVEKDVRIPKLRGEGLRSPRIVSDTAEVISIDRSRPIGHSAFKGSTASHKGYGVFEARIRTASGRELDAVVKILPPHIVDEAFFASEVEGAKAAAATGYGPEFYGVVPMGKDYAFAMEKFKGGLTENYAQPGSPEFGKAEAETQAAIDALSPKTADDVRKYGEALWNLGYRVSGDFQGMIMADGSWRPIDFSCVSKLPADPAEALKLKPEHLATVEREASLYEKQIAQREAANRGP
jgi:hypothetical protein